MNMAMLIVLDELKHHVGPSGLFPKHAFLSMWYDGSPGKPKMRRALAQLLREGFVRRVKVERKGVVHVTYGVSDLLTQIAHAAKKGQSS